MLSSRWKKETSPKVDHVNHSRQWMRHRNERSRSSSHSARDEQVAQCSRLYNAIDVWISRRSTGQYQYGQQCNHHNADRFVTGRIHPNVSQWCSDPDSAPSRSSETWHHTDSPRPIPQCTSSIENIFQTRKRRVRQHFDSGATVCDSLSTLRLLFGATTRQGNHGGREYESIAKRPSLW
jgi:hypothetical protein